VLQYLWVLYVFSVAALIGFSYSFLSSFGNFKPEDYLPATVCYFLTPISIFSGSVFSPSLPSVFG